MKKLQQGHKEMLSDVTMHGTPNIKRRLNYPDSGLQGYIQVSLRRAIMPRRP
jgi:hypothetical protein